ncbi:MAG: translational GTPase TypA [Deltaproteobacteria bacterium]|nr:translational GTPase TypA [Deltaproteobacteria bacterium]
MPLGGPEVESELEAEKTLRQDLRNIAIIAHVDHGKTTLVDALFQQSGIYKDHQQAVDRAMDTNDQERERGITILAKCTSVKFGRHTLQIVDTPGHSDFGGEVERSLRMVDGVLLLVDAAEGPLPQTRFVLRKAMELNLPCVVAINKIDRGDARPEEVLDEVYDLFIELGADESQLDFPVLYLVARDGLATLSPNEVGRDLQPLVKTILEAVPPPADETAEPFCMQANSLAYDDYVGRLVIGRVLSGQIVIGQNVAVMDGEGGAKQARVSGIFSFHGLQRINHEIARCGDIVAVAGIDDVSIGDTLCDPEHHRTLPRIQVDEPTVVMTFQINDGPMAGRSGKFLTSRQLRDRLYREAFANVSIRVSDGETPEQFRVMGRGDLQLAVLIESLRREGYELCVRKPEVLTRWGEQGKEEPVERLVIDVPPEHMGAVSDALGRRKANMLDQRQDGSRMRLEYRIPTRGLFGLRSQLLTVTRGTALQHSIFDGWVPWAGPLPKRLNGALVSDRLGKATPYALFHMQPRGVLFVRPGTEVYEGMVVGEHCRENDLNINAVRPKKLTNVRASGKDEATVVSPPRLMPLERCLEWVEDDEMVEVTPDAIRLRKRILPANRRSIIRGAKKH